MAVGRHGSPKKSQQLRRLHLEHSKELGDVLMLTRSHHYHLHLASESRMARDWLHGEIKHETWKTYRQIPHHSLING